MHFQQISYLSSFQKSVKNITVSLNLIKMSALHEDQRTFLIISHSVLITMGTVSDKSRKRQNTHILCSVTFFFENHFICEIKW